jgi:hypothetical protein
MGTPTALSSGHRLTGGKSPLRLAASPGAPKGNVNAVSPEGPIREISPAAGRRKRRGQVVPSNARAVVSGPSGRPPVDADQRCTPGRDAPDDLFDRAEADTDDRDPLNREQASRSRRAAPVAPATVLVVSLERTEASGLVSPLAAMFLDALASSAGVRSGAERRRRRPIRPR